MSYENNNTYSVSGNHTLTQWADKNLQIPQSKMNKLIMDYLVTGKS